MIFESSCRLSVRLATRSLELVRHSWAFVAFPFREDAESRLGISIEEERWDSANVGRLNALALLVSVLSFVTCFVLCSISKGLVAIDPVVGAYLPGAQKHGRYMYAIVAFNTTKQNKCMLSVWKYPLLASNWSSGHGCLNLVFKCLFDEGWRLVASKHVSELLCNTISLRYSVDCRSFQLCDLCNPRLIFWSCLIRTIMICLLHSAFQVIYCRILSHKPCKIWFCFWVRQFCMKSWVHP